MKQLEIKLIISLSMFVSLFMTSCASTKFKGSAVCTGRVCGTRGEPVPNYKLSFGVGKTVYTNDNGTFMIPEMKAGNYQLSGGASGWTCIDEEIKFVDRKSVICVQVEPVSAVYSRIENYLREGLYIRAEKILDEQKYYNGGDEQFKFYSALIAYCKSPSKFHKAKLLKFLEVKQ